MMGFGPKLRHFSQFKDPQNTKYLDYEDPATHKGQTKLQLKMHVPHGQNYASAYSAIINQCFVSYASLLCFFQAVAVSYAKQVVKLMVSLFMAGKGTDETNKELNTQKMGASLIHNNFYFQRYVTLTAQTSLMAFIKAHQR